MSFGLGISFGRLCGGSPKKPKNETLMFIHDFYHDIEDSGLNILKIHLPQLLYEKVFNWIDDNLLFGKEIVIFEPEEDYLYVCMETSECLFKSLYPIGNFLVL